jgi:hypothetical protein
MKTAPCKEAIDLRRDTSSVEGYFSLETAANLLRLLERISTVFSKCALKSS